MDSRLGRAIPKAIKIGSGSSLADTGKKRVVPGRYKKAGKYLLKVCYVAVKALRSLCCLSKCDIK